jgi:hypothetical protein
VWIWVTQDCFHEETVLDLLLVRKHFEACSNRHTRTACLCTHHQDVGSAQQSSILDASWNQCLIIVIIFGHFHSFPSMIYLLCSRHRMSTELSSLFWLPLDCQRLNLCRWRYETSVELKGVRVLWGPQLTRFWDSLPNQVFKDRDDPKGHFLRRSRSNRLAVIWILPLWSRFVEMTARIETRDSLEEHLLVK